MISKRKAPKNYKIKRFPYKLKGQKDLLSKIKRNKTQPRQPTLSEKHIEYLAKTLVKQIDAEIFQKKYASVKNVLNLVGAGFFLAGSIAFPNLPQALKSLAYNPEEHKVWKRFNISYLKRTLRRLEKQKLIEVDDEDNFQVVKITDSGRKRVLKYALDELKIKKPISWDGKWRLVSYDIPKGWDHHRKVFREYMKCWGFYPLHESVYLHAYSCEKEIDFLRNYLLISEHVRIFIVDWIENDQLFKDFFGI